MLTVHGTMRLFYTCFDVVGDPSDERLFEVLDGVGEDDRRAFTERLGRHGEALHDGHCSFWSAEHEGFLGYVGVQIDHLDGVPIIQRSKVEGIEAGDRRVS